jgi:hypothetical protein
MSLETKKMQLREFWNYITYRLPQSSQTSVDDSNFEALLRQYPVHESKVRIVESLLKSGFVKSSRMSNKIYLKYIILEYNNVLDKYPHVGFDRLDYNTLKNTSAATQIVNEIKRQGFNGYLNRIISTLLNNVLPAELNGQINEIIALYDTAFVGLFDNLTLGKTREVIDIIENNINTNGYIGLTGAKAFFVNNAIRQLEKGKGKKSSDVQNIINQRVAILRKSISVRPTGRSGKPSAKPTIRTGRTGKPTVEPESGQHNVLNTPESGIQQFREFLIEFGIGVSDKEKKDYENQIRELINGGVMYNDAVERSIHDLLKERGRQGEEVDYESGRTASGQVNRREENIRRRDEHRVETLDNRGNISGYRYTYGFKYVGMPRTLNNRLVNGGFNINNDTFKTINNSNFEQDVNNHDYLVISNEGGGHCYYLSLIDSGATFKLLKTSQIGQLMTNVKNGIEGVDASSSLANALARLGSLVDFALDPSYILIHTNSLTTFNDLLIRDTEHETINDELNEDSARYQMLRLLRWVASQVILAAARDREYHDIITLKLHDHYPENVTNSIVDRLENGRVIYEENDDDKFERLLNLYVGEIQNETKWAHFEEILLLERELNFKSIIITGGTIGDGNDTTHHLTCSGDGTDLINSNLIVPIWHFGGHFEAFHYLDPNNAQYYSYFELTPVNRATYYVPVDLLTKINREC